MLNDGRKVFFSEDKGNKGLAALFEFARSIAMKKRVYLVLDNPSGEDYDLAATFDRLSAFGLMKNENRVQHNHLFEGEQDSLHQEMIGLATRNGISIIDPVPAMCKNGLCPVTLNGKPIYKDESHIRPFWVQKYAHYFDAAVRDHVELAR